MVYASREFVRCLRGCSHFFIWLERGQSKTVKECNFRFHVLRGRPLYHGSFLACFNDKGKGRDKTYPFMKQEILL